MGSILAIESLNERLTGPETILFDLNTGKEIRFGAAKFLVAGSSPDELSLR
jgi:hypothetical protein